MGTKREGGLQAQQTLIAKLGVEEVHRRRVEQGRKGGAIGRGGGWTLTGDPKTDAFRSERARVAGKRGGAASRRGKAGEQR